MASITRIHGAQTALLTNYYTSDTLYVQIYIANTDMTAEAELEGGALEAIIKLVQPLAYRCQVQGGHTYIFAFISGAFSNDISVLETEIQRLGSSVGPNNVDVSGAAVIEMNID